MAQQFSACLRPRARFGVPGLSPTSFSLHGACFALCLCLCLSFSVSLMNKIFKNNNNKGECPHLCFSFLVNSQIFTFQWLWVWCMKFPNTIFMVSNNTSFTKFATSLCSECMLCYPVTRQRCQESNAKVKQREMFESGIIFRQSIY